MSTSSACLFSSRLFRLIGCHIASISTVSLLSLLFCFVLFAYDGDEIIKSINVKERGEKETQE